MKQPDILQEKADRRPYKSSYLGVDFARLASYRQQMQYVVRERHARALLIGKGDGIVPQLIRDLGVEVVVLDIDPDLNPDLLGSVEHIPSEDGSFDVCVCCQVLEHLPFEKFPLCLGEIARVTRKNLVLSLPDIRRYASLRLRLGRIRWALSMNLPRLRKPAFPADRLRNHGHHWEIGFRGFSLNRVNEAIGRAGWKLVECRRVPDLAWHTFFYCQARGRHSSER